MRDFFSKTACWIQTSSVKRFLVGVWLFILYFICVNMVVFSLSTYLFQLKLNSLIKKGAKNESPLVEHYCDTSRINENESSGFLKRVPCIPIESFKRKSFFTSAEILLVYNESKLKKDEYFQAYPQYEKAQAAMEMINQQLLNEKDEKEKEKLELNKSVIQANLDFSQHIMKKFEDVAADELSSIFVEIDHFEKFFRHISWILGGVEYYWAFPQPILKIVLVISMGILGSLIFVTIEFIKEPKGHQRFNMYFFRPALGMIVALAMYVMVKSGQSTIVDSSDQDLSPFLISFLGIISGMLSEQAYRKIASKGNSLLLVEDKTTKPNSSKDS